MYLCVCLGHSWIGLDWIDWMAFAYCIISFGNSNEVYFLGLMVQILKIKMKILYPLTLLFLSCFSNQTTILDRDTLFQVYWRSKLPSNTTENLEEKKVDNDDSMGLLASSMAVLEPQPPFIHGRHTCDGCSVTPIIGKRYHATNNFCNNNFDLCEKCWANYTEAATEADIQFEPIELGKFPIIKFYLLFWI